MCFPLVDDSGYGRLAQIRFEAITPKSFKYKQQMSYPSDLLCECSTYHAASYLIPKRHNSET